MAGSRVEAGIVLRDARRLNRSKHFCRKGKVLRGGSWPDCATGLPPLVATPCRPASRHRRPPAPGSCAGRARGASAPRAYFTGPSCTPFAQPKNRFGLAASTTFVLSGFIVSCFFPAASFLLDFFVEGMCSPLCVEPVESHAGRRLCWSHSAGSDGMSGPAPNNIALHKFSRRTDSQAVLR